MPDDATRSQVLRRARLGLDRDGAFVALGGSRATMLDCFRTLIRQCGLTVDDAVALTSTNPARILGHEQRKRRIAPGWDADFVIVDDQLQLQGVAKAQNVEG